MVVPVWECLEREQLLFDADPRLLMVVGGVCFLAIMTGIYYAVYWLAALGLIVIPGVIGIQRAAQADPRARRVYLRAFAKPLYLPRVGKRRTSR